MATTVAPSKNGTAKKTAPKKAATAVSVKPASNGKEQKVVQLEPSNMVALRKEKFRQFFSLQEKHEKLIKTQHKLSELINQNDPIDGSLQLIIKDKDDNSYNSDGRFGTTNQEIIAEALSCLKSKVDFMLDEVKQEILEVSI